MSTSKTELASIATVLGIFALIAAFLGTIYILGFNAGYKQSIKTERWYEQKYQGVIQALITEAQWVRSSISDIKQSLPSSQPS